MKEVEIVGKAVDWLGRFVAVEGIVAMRDKQLSVECSEVFAEMVVSAKDRLNVLTFALLRRRALEGREL
jgi:hypothetical protein